MSLLLLLAALLATEPGADAAAAKRSAPAAAEAPASESPSKVRLAPGTQKVLDVADVKRLAVGNPDVFDVKPLGGGQLLLVGLGHGSSTLLVFDSRGRHRTWEIEVETGELDRDTVVHELLRASPEATIRNVGGRIVVEGLVRSPGELAMLAELSGVVVLATLDPRVVDARVLQINAELQRLGLSGARAVLVGRSKLLLEGSVGSEEERRKAQLVADALFADLLPYL